MSTTAIQIRKQLDEAIALDHEEPTSESWWRVNKLQSLYEQLTASDSQAA